MNILQYFYTKAYDLSTIIYKKITDNLGWIGLQGHWENLFYNFISLILMKKLKMGLYKIFF